MSPDQDKSLKIKYARSPDVSVCLGKDMAILFNPDTGREKYLNPTALFVWERLDGSNTAGDIAHALGDHYECPTFDEVRQDIVHLIDELSVGHYILAASEGALPAVAEDYPLKEDRPSNLDISLTGKCNLHCDYCFYNREMCNRPDLSKEAWFAFFHELKTLAVRNLTLSGGEVFVRKDLWEIIDRLIECRMRYSILSNGTLITEKTLSELDKEKRRLRMNSIQVSIDGSGAEIHDKSRGRGSFQRAIQGLRLLKEARFPATVRVTVNRFNVDDLENIARLLLENIGLGSFGTNDAMPMGAGCDNQAGITLNPRQHVQAMQTLHRLQKAYPGRITASAGPLAKWTSYGDMEHAKSKGEKAGRGRMGYLTACGCIYNKLAVHHDGVIVPCNMLAELDIGIMNRDSIKTLWKTHPFLKALKDRHAISMRQVAGCEDCEWAPFCNGGCPGLALTMTGDFNRANPHDCYRDFLKKTGLTSETVPWGVGKTSVSINKK